MKIYSYRLLPGTALLCLMLTSPCLADSSGFDIPNQNNVPNPYGGGATGVGFEQAIGQVKGNVTGQYDQYGTFTHNTNPLANGNPYDNIPINQLQTTNGDGSGQQIYDYPNAGQTGTYAQTPKTSNFRNVQGNLSSTGAPTGLLPTYTSILAGAIPNPSGIGNALNSPGQYAYTEIPFVKSQNYSYGFNTSAVPQAYSGLAHPTSTNMPTNLSNALGGGMLPPTSTSAVDLDIVNSGYRYRRPQPGASGTLEETSDTPGKLRRNRNRANNVDDLSPTIAPFSN